MQVGAKRTLWALTAHQRARYAAAIVVMGVGTAFLLLVPVLGVIALFVLSLISFWRIFEKLKYSGWLALIPLLGFIPTIGGFATIAFLIVLGVVAWRKR